jgi:hypothetical protein
MSKLAFKPELLADNARLPDIKSWLLETVWTRSRYHDSEPEQYLRGGEEAVYGLEELIATGAQEIWGELAAESRSAPTIKTWLGLDASSSNIHHPPSPKAAVVLDGLSLREFPLMLKLAEDSGFRVKSASAVATCLPTETTDFVEQRVLGARLSPSALPGRTELTEHNVEAFYLEHPTSRYTPTKDRSVLLWSTYPDRLFADDAARTEALFTNFHRNYIPTIWKNSVQTIPRGLPIVVTSDHGYIFLGASFETTRASEAPSLLGQSRFKEFVSGESFPQWNPDLQLLPERRVALLRGRMRTRPQGASSRKLYQHGGFSLMEVLVPWIELEPRG